MLLYNLSMFTPEEAQERIAEMVRLIVKRFQPHRIYLFGSRARGDAGPDSDVDLLIVMPILGSKLSKRVEIRMALHDVKMAKDIAIVTPEEYARYYKIPGTLPRIAEKEGKLLYERAA